MRRDEKRTVTKRPTRLGRARKVKSKIHKVLGEDVGIHWKRCCFISILSMIINSHFGTSTKINKILRLVY